MFEAVSLLAAVLVVLQLRMMVTEQTLQLQLQQLQSGALVPLPSLLAALWRLMPSSSWQRSWQPLPAS